LADSIFLIFKPIYLNVTTMEDNSHPTF